MGSQESVDFRGALARPFARICERQGQSEFISGDEDLLARARGQIAGLTGLAQPERIVFGRNTTEAISLIPVLAGVQTGQVTISDAEYASVARSFREHRDHGNTRRTDPLTTWSPPAILEDWPGPASEPAPSGIDLRVVPFLGEWDSDRFADRVPAGTGLVLISHVIRCNGRIVDIARLAARLKSRHPQAMLAVDGAFACGNLERLDFAELEAAGVDFYAISPHKTLKSLPLGVLLLSRRAARNIPRLRNADRLNILRGMVAPEYGDICTVPVELNPRRARALSVALDCLRSGGWLRDTSFAERLTAAGRLRERMLAGLSLPPGQLLVDAEARHVPAMLSFRAPEGRSRLAVERLAEAGIYCCYIPEMDALRVCFDVEHRPADVDRFVAAWKALFQMIPVGAEKAGDE